jgi:CHAT domain-containing protein
VLVFVVARNEVQVIRQLASVELITQAQTNLRFQLGRAEVGSEYVERQKIRLMRGAREALGQLYELLIAPLAAYLWAQRILIVPYGVLHLVPFHALWDGGSYWVEQVEINYMPSASIAVHLGRDFMKAPLLSFTGSGRD